MALLRHHSPLRRLLLHPALAPRARHGAALPQRHLPPLCPARARKQLRLPKRIPKSQHRLRRPAGTLQRAAALRRPVP